MSADRDPLYFPLPLRLEVSAKGRLATLIEQFTFVDWKGLEPVFQVIVPKGFQTDFNSVPRGLWNIFSPWEYPEAGVVHDFLYRHPEIKDRAEADRTHRRIMKLMGAPKWLRWSAWAALRVFGWRYWATISDTTGKSTWDPIPDNEIF